MALTDDDRVNLTAYLDGELDDEASQALEAKLSVDQDARAEVEQLRQTWGMLDFLPRAQPSADFTNRTMERLSLEALSASAGQSSKVQLVPLRGGLGWQYVAGWTASVLVAIGAGAALSNLPGLNRAPDPFFATDEVLLRNLRLLEKWHLYELVEDLDFLRQLDHPELFGDEAGT